MYEHSENMKRIESTIEDKSITEEQHKGSLNNKGTQPLMMKFQGLELENRIIQPNKTLDNDDNKMQTKFNSLGYDAKLLDN